MTTNENNVIGAAGEHRVVSELLLRGHVPLIATVDDGVDIIIDGGPSLQVKSSNAPRWQGEKANYRFHFHTTRWHGPTRHRRPSMRADFAVCWCIPINAFYVIPREALGGRDSVCVAPDADESRPSMWDDYREAWALLSPPRPVDLVDRKPKVA